jgi:hypothetical protein
MYRITIMTVSLLLALVGVGCAPFADLLWPSRTNDRARSAQTRISAEELAGREIERRGSRCR